MLLTVLILKSFFLLPAPTWAQDIATESKIPQQQVIENQSEQPSQPLSQPEEEFAGIVQHAQKIPKIIANQKTKTVDFKDVIHFSDEIKIPKGSRLKIITQKRCIAVFYAGANTLAPASKEMPWEVKQGPVRWICPEEKIEKIIFRGQELQIQNGELLLYGNSLVVLKSQIFYNGQMLKPNTVYDFHDGSWVIAQNQPEAYEFWTKTIRYALPVESVQNELPKPSKPITSRIFLTPLFGFGGVQNYDQGHNYSAYGMKGDGARLGTNFLWKNKSVFLFFDFYKARTPNHGNYRNGPPPVGTKDISTDNFTIGIGLRNNHQKSGSSYFYGGLTRLRYDFIYSQEQFETFGGQIRYPLALTGGFGYQKTIFNKSWLALTLGGEFRITQTLSRGEIVNNFQPFNQDHNPRAYLTNYAVIIYLGPIIQF